MTKRNNLRMNLRGQPKEETENNWIPGDIAESLDPKHSPL
jgi:hypothetical protein